MWGLLESIIELVFQLHIFGIMALLLVAFALIFRKKISKICTVKTTLLSLAISLFGGVGLFSFFAWLTILPRETPIEYQFFIACGIISFVSFVATIVFYAILRKRKFSAFGLIFDVLTSIITLPFFFRMFLEICSFLDGKAFFILPIT
ncbi:MAG: hypothetical protein IKJ50_07280 [Clostridia bacterium]|nr:hypothetical protein [Clostridia bacterium]